MKDRMLDSVFNLREVKERIGYVDKLTKGKHKIKLIVYAEPTKDQPYYWIKVWEDNGISMVTHFDFFAYPKPFTIKVYDSAEDAEISLEEWRQQRKTSQ